MKTKLIKFISIQLLINMILIQQVSNMCYQVSTQYCLWAFNDDEYCSFLSCTMLYNGDKYMKFEDCYRECQLVLSCSSSDGSLASIEDCQNQQVLKYALGFGIGFGYPIMGLILGLACAEECDERIAIFFLWPLLPCLLCFMRPRCNCFSNNKITKIWGNTNCNIDVSY